MPSLRAAARWPVALLLAVVALAAQPVAPPRLRFPLAVDATARHLLDAAAQPVFLQGDSPWSLIVGITEVEAELYLADREAKGVNALIVNLVEHKFNGPANRKGDVPFTTPGDLATPGEAYFAHADRVLRRAEAHGMAVLLNPLYLGYKGLDEGWYQEAILNGPRKCRQYGRYVGRRYAGFANIVWTAGGDRLPGDARECVASVAGGIREASGGALWTAHAEPNASTMDAYDYVGLDLNATYSYQIVHEHLRRDRGRRPAMPFVLFESSYEGEHNASPVQIRRQAWWALLAGATGQFYGARPVWLFDPGWKEALQLPGARDLARFAALVRELPWWQFVPDGDHQVVDGGLGELNGLDTLAAASTVDGRMLVAYAPSARTIGVQLGKLKGDRFTGYWWDPRTGAKAPIAPLDGGRRVELKTTGDGDWALVLSAP
jgi:hypothetical protein